MFSQNLYSSPATTWRKLGSITASFVLHALAVALILSLGLLCSGIVRVEANGSLVATLSYSSWPGDPNQPESQPNTWHVSQAEVVPLRSHIASKIPSAIPVEIVLPNLTIIGPMEPIPSLDFGRHGRDGPCGCVPNPYGRQFHPESPVKLPFLGRQSQLSQAVLIKKIDPEYPSFAKRVGIQGAVVLHAIIDRHGMVTAVTVVSGPELLRGAVIAAVRQWRYQPYVLDGIAMQIEATITVNFVLPGSGDPNPVRTL